VRTVISVDEKNRFAHIKKERVAADKMAPERWSQDSAKHQGADITREKRRCRSRTSDFTGFFTARSLHVNSRVAHGRMHILQMSRRCQIVSCQVREGQSGEAA
jgi:hypothetical protein